MMLWAAAGRGESDQKNGRGCSAGDNGRRTAAKTGRDARRESKPMGGTGKTIDEGVVYAAAGLRAVLRRG